MTLERHQVIRSCAGSSSAECSYPVFFSFSAMREATGISEKLPKSVAALPAGLVSVLTSIQNTDAQQKCVLEDLDKFLGTAREISQTGESGSIVIGSFPGNLDWCFKAGPSDKTETHLFIRNGEIPGYMICAPDSDGIDLCNINFSRASYPSEGNSEALIERLSIGAFSANQIEEFFAHFPKFSPQSDTVIETQFLNTLSWARDLLSDGMKRVEW